jgi:hypothetical protein
VFHDFFLPPCATQALVVLSPRGDALRRIEAPSPEHDKDAEARTIFVDGFPLKVRRVTSCKLFLSFFLPTFFFFGQVKNA